MQSGRERMSGEDGVKRAGRPRKAPADALPHVGRKRRTVTDRRMPGCSFPRLLLRKGSEILHDHIHRIKLTAPVEDISGMRVIEDDA